MDKFLVSIVVPFYSGEKYLRRLFDEILLIKNEWEKLDYPMILSELNFVDDSSIDNSLSVAEEIAGEYSWVRVLTLSKNYGQHSATIAGILYSSGDWIVTMDEDLQHSPKEISKLIYNSLKKSIDITYANSSSSIHNSIFRDFSSRFYKKILSFITKSPHINKFNSFRLIRGHIGRAAAAVCGHAMYLDVAFSWFTDRIDSIYVEMKDERYSQEKKSGYTLRKLIKHAKRLLISTQPSLIKIGSLFGIISLVISLAYGSYILYLKLFTTEILNARGWTSTVLIILFLGGMISFMIGVVLEYIGIILLQGQGKPTYFVIDRSFDKKYLEVLESKNDNFRT